MFSFGFLGKSKKVWPASSRDTCVGGGLGVLQLCIPAARSSGSWGTCTYSMLAPRETLLAPFLWASLWMVLPRGCSDLGCRDRCGTMPQPLMLTNGHWVFLDLGLPGSWALLGPCSFVLPWWEYFKAESLPLHVRSKQATPKNKWPLLKAWWGSRKATFQWMPAGSGYLRHQRCLGKSQTLMKSSSSQLSLHVPAKAVCVSFAGSRLSLFPAWEQRCFKERRRVPGALQCKILAALKAPVAWNVGTTDPAEDRFILWVSKCFPRSGLPAQAFCYFPWFAFCHSFFPFFCC